jgi:hypothetical protein
MAVRRVAPVAVVRRRLAQVEARPADDHVVRRRARRIGRSALSSMPLGKAEPDLQP